MLQYIINIIIGFGNCLTNYCFVKWFALRFKGKNLYQPLKQILAQTQFRRNNANALYDFIGASLLNKNIF